jgi:dimethylaniline monooxygenase (N-oxide forming)
LDEWRTSVCLPEPDHRVGEAHPTVSDRLLPLLRHGKVQIRGPIQEVLGNRISFASAPGALSQGREVPSDEVDIIIYCTGYKISFPFFDSDYIDAPDNQIPLLGQVFHPRERRIFFVGLAQTLGAIANTAERQAAWIAEHIVGGYNLPDVTEFSRILERDELARAARYVRSRRHTIQLDPYDFNRSLTRELAAGRRRARLGQGQAFPAPRAPEAQRKQKDGEHWHA